MPTQVFTFYRLNEGVDVEEFKKWSRTVDQPTCHRMPAVHSFDVFINQGEVNGKPFFDVVENIVVESWEAWQETQKSEAFAHVVADWPRFGDGSTFTSIHCEKV